MIKKFISVLTVCLMIVALAAPFASAGSVCISELAIGVGSDGTAKLESEGFTVLFQGMNIVSEENSAVFLGYKTGGTKITGLTVSSSKSDSVQVNGITYSLVSGVSLNYGTEGKPVYLYSTKDAKAGDGIAALETVAVSDDSMSYDSIFNDCSTLLLDVDGKPANLDSGIDGCELYVKVISCGLVKPYISDAYLVKGSSRNAALKEAINKGFVNFLDEDLDDSQSFAYLAYNRTADSSEALREIKLSSSDSMPEGFVQAGSINNRKLYITREGSAALIDVSTELLFEGEYSFGEWIELFVASVPPTASRSVIRQETSYKALRKSTDICSAVSAGTAETGTVLYAMYNGKIEGTTDVTATSAESDTETTETQEQTVAVEEMTDEFIEVEKTEDSSESEESTETDATVSSVFGHGNVKIITCSVAVLAVIIIATCIIMRKKRRK